MKFSAVICTYNYGHLLPEALHSVAAQTLSDFELLVVDDGSTDNTAAVVEQFSRTFPCCVYLKKPHTGLADSRNAGVRAATGTHIAFLDADDLWAPDYLDTVNAIFSANRDIELVYADVLRTTASGELLPPFFPNGLPAVQGRLKSHKEVFLVFPWTTPSATAFAKSLYDRIGGYDVRFPVSGEDLDWIIRAALQNAVFARLDRRLVLQRVHDSNMTGESDWLVEAWLSMYTRTLQPGAGDAEVAALARTRTWKWLLPSLARYSPARGRQLITEAMRVFPEDRALRAAHLSSYLGLSYVLKAMRRIKRAASRIARPARRVDLSAPPERLFADLSRLDH